jgi:acyl carrier protein phosphodiesterase
MEQMAFDDFEQRHPPNAALDDLLYDVVCELVPDDADAGFGQTWVDHLVAHADHDLPAGPARWVRLAVGLASDEYQLGNAELEAIERVRGGIRPDRDSYLVTWFAQVDQRPRAELLRDGVQALVWLRDFTW